MIEKLEYPDFGKHKSIVIDKTIEKINEIIEHINVREKKEEEHITSYAKYATNTGWYEIL